MTSFVVYNLTTGAIRTGSVINANDIPSQAMEGEAVVAGMTGNWRTQRMNLGTLELEDIPPPTLTLAELRAKAKAALGQRRWEVETGGMEYGGFTVATDDRSKLLITAAANQAREDSGFTTEWKMADGTWASLDAATLIAVYNAVFAWVAACFAREQGLGLLIDAAADAAAVDALTSTINQFWP